MIEISSDLNNARLQGVLDFLASGTGDAQVAMYSGTRPAFGQAATGDLLAAIPLPEPAGQISAGVLTLTPTDEALVLISGTAAWARVRNGDNAIAFDCDVSDLTGAGELKLASTTLYAGGHTRIVSGTLA